MIGIVLAAGLGTNSIIVALLFRRERQLSRQLSDMRAERNSEWILHALQGVPDEQEQIASAANGDFEPSAAGPEPVRRKKHLGLFLGGGSAAALGALWRTGRRAWQHNPSLIMAGAAGAATVTTVAVVLTGTQGGNHTGATPPSSPPTVTAIVTASRTPSSGLSSMPTTGPPAVSGGAVGPGVGGSGRAFLVSTPPTPGGEASSGGGLQPTASGPESTRPPSASPSDAPSPSTPPGTHAACPEVDVESLLDLAICLAGGR